MDNINIKNIDLNLLRAFVVLMEEQNVSRASQRLNLSQSATSNALERIRASFHDRVLEREGRTMVPSRRALMLWPQISKALADIETALDSVAQPDPGTMQAHFTIGIDEYSMILFGKQLYDLISRQAPQVTLSFEIVKAAHYTSTLSLSKADVLIVPVWQSLPELVQQKLYSETFIGLMCKDHPLSHKTVTIKRYIDYPHMLISASGIVQGNVNVGLQQHKLTRRVVMSTPWFESAPSYLAGSELLLTMGKQLAQRLLSRYPVIPFDLPIAVPGFDVCMLWHPRNTSDGHHQWLRAKISEVFGDSDVARDNQEPN